VIPVEVTQTPWHYTTFWDWVDHWQTLIAGLVALLAALIAIFGAEFFARCKERREIQTLRATLAVEIRQYIDILIKTREILRRRSGPEKRMLARDLRSVVAFHPPTVYPASADKIGLLGPLAVSVTSFYSTIERLNFTVRFLTDDPEELASHANIEAVASLLEQACRTSLPLLFKFPLDERDDEFRAKIAKWDAERPAEPLIRA
jgi:hypothetical protein